MSSGSAASSSPPSPLDSALNAYRERRRPKGSPGREWECRAALTKAPWWKWSPARHRPPLRPPAASPRSRCVLHCAPTEAQSSRPIPTSTPHQTPGSARAVGTENAIYSRNRQWKSPGTTKSFPGMSPGAPVGFVRQQARACEGGRDVKTHLVLDVAARAGRQQHVHDHNVTVLRRELKRSPPVLQPHSTPSGLPCRHAHP